MNIKELLNEMTLKEKIGQLNQTFCGWNSYSIENGEIKMTSEFEKCLREGGNGAIYGMHRAGDISPEEGARAINMFQKIAVEESRLGIPLLISEECPKGYNAIGSTIFPSPLAYASSFNREMTKKIGEASAREVKAGGGNIGYGPILDICHDPRWSRMEEIYGEDPYLSGELGAELVKGIQSQGILSTLKHFVAYGTTEGGRNTAPAHMGPRELREMHMPSFKKAVEAGAKSVMCSYNEIDGVPVSASRELLTDVLRTEWGFDGFVVSDALAIDELAVRNSENIKHRVAEDLAQAAGLSLYAGVDISLWDEAYLHLEEALEKGYISMEDIDLSVERILQAKLDLGLFDNPYVDEKQAAKIMGCSEHKELSLEASRQSVILLQNNGVLPLSKSSNVAVIGPNAHNVANMLGTYTPDGVDGVTVYDGFMQLSKGDVKYSLGCRIKDMDDRWLGEASEIAEQSDVNVVVVGGSSKQEIAVKVNAAGQIDIDLTKDNDIDCGENIDRATLELAGLQNELLKQIKASGKPLVVVLIQGRAYDMQWIKENADAVICAWYPGPFGGQAIAEVCYGDVNPSAKLTVSIPKTIGQIPINYNHKPSAEKRYMDCDMEPMYRFGHGLSYSEFKYSNLEIEVLDANLDNPKVKVSVDVENTGQCDGTEIVLLYVRDEVSTVTRPIKELKGFERVFIPAGEKRRVEFVLEKEAFAFYNLRMDYVVEPGEFTVDINGVVNATFRLANI